MQDSFQLDKAYTDADPIQSPARPIFATAPVNLSYTSNDIWKGSFD